MDFSDLGSARYLLAAGAGPGGIAATLADDYSRDQNNKKRDAEYNYQQNKVNLANQNRENRNADMAEGSKYGQELFVNDPEMQQLKQRYAEQSQGYSGSEFGALRAGARAEMAGERASAQNSLQGKAAKQGVTGARAAAMSGAANEKYVGQQAQAERQMAVDNAKMIRQGTNDLSSFIMRQKMGVLGTSLGFAQMGVADRTGAAQQALAEKKEDKGWVNDFLGNPFG